MQASAGSGADNCFCRRDVAELMIELSTKQSSRADFADDRKATRALARASRAGRSDSRGGNHEVHGGRGGGRSTASHSVPLERRTAAAMALATERSPGGADRAALQGERFRGWLRVGEQEVSSRSAVAVDQAPGWV